MRMHLYTLHGKGADGGDAPLVAVADRFDCLAFLLPPLWAVWHGLWLTLLAEAALLTAAALWSPAAIPPVYIGLTLILAFEGGSVHRAELGLRRWRELALVEARSPEGAEEMFLTGRAVGRTA